MAFDLFSFAYIRSISHHHGVGKHRTSFLPATIGQTGITTLRAVKDALDPTNVFSVGNLFEEVH